MRTHYRLALLATLFFLSASGLRSASAQAASPEPATTFLLVSDFHFNPFADPALVPALAAADPHHWEAILNRSKLNTYSQIHQDTNWPLLQSTLRAMRVTQPRAPLVLVTGDLLAHQFPQAFQNATHDKDREHYRAFVLKTVTFLAWQLQKQFPRAQILLTPGNNDDECGDYQIEADGPFLADTAELARTLAGGSDSFTTGWKALGSYPLEPRNLPAVRILAVNSVFFSNKYQSASLAHGCALADSTATDRTFAWLADNLAHAKAANQKVWLMLHIPPGIDGFSTLSSYLRLAFTGIAGTELCQKAIVPMWKPDATARFAALLQDHQATITATFAGHDHTDDFRVLPAAGVAGFVLIDPPVSPIYGQNPSFRLVSYRKDGTLTDQATWYLTNLKQAGKKHPGIWAQEYSFVKEWQTPQLDAAALETIDQHIKTEPAARAQWYKLLNTSSTDNQVPAVALPALYCAIDALDPATYQTCYCPK